jgi:hypothetical protein
MKFLVKYKLIIIGMIAGAAGGYAYYTFVGCSSGGCAITSNPVNSTIYGAIMGGLFFDLFRKPNKQKNQENES